MPPTSNYSLTRERHGKMKAEAGLTLPQVKEHEIAGKAPSVRRWAWKRFFLTVFQKNHPCQHLDL